MNNRALTALPNIGKTVAARLHEIGITSEAELRKIGSAKAYRWMPERHAGRHLPVCYYLYSLEGAIQDKYWDDFAVKEKEQLRRKAGLKK